MGRVIIYIRMHFELFSHTIWPRQLSVSSFSVCPRNSFSWRLGQRNLKIFPGLRPWTPLGGSERPPNPQFFGDDADASSNNALRALIDALRASYLTILLISGFFINPHFNPWYKHSWFWVVVRWIHAMLSGSKVG